MERAVRTISLERGYDPREFTLVAFGGAGPQHACELAEGLGISRVLVPASPGALSAYGVAIADVVKDYSQTALYSQEHITPERLKSAFRSLESRGLAELRSEGVARRRTKLRRLLDVRYVGQSYELTVDCPPLGERVATAVAKRFHAAHGQRFGYADQNAAIEVVNLRLKAVGIVEVPSLAALPVSKVREDAENAVEHGRVIFAQGALDTLFLHRGDLAPGDRIPGPAVVLQMDATTVIPPGWRAIVDPLGNLVLEPLR